MTWPDRTTAEVATGRYPNAGPLRRANHAERLLEESRARVLGFSETTAIGRRETDEALQHAEGRHERRVSGHPLRRRRVDTEPVLDGVDAGLDRDRGAPALRMRGDALPALVHRGHGGHQLVDRERDLLAGASGVDRDLYEVRARIHLRDRCLPQLVAGVHEDDERREFVSPCEPGPGRDDRRSIDPATVRVADAQVETARRTDVPRGQDAHAREIARRFRAAGE